MDLFGKRYTEPFISIKSLVNNIHDMNTELRQNELKRAKEKVILKNYFFKMINNGPF